MSEENKDLTVPNEILPPAFTMNNNLTLNDILSVAVGKVENELRSKLRTSVKNINAIEKTIRESEKALEKAGEEVLDSCGLGAELKVLGAPLKKLFPRDNFRSLTKPRIDLNRETSTVHFSYDLGYNTSESRDVDFTPEMTELFEAMDQQRDNLTLEQQESLSIRSKLSNIPALERRYKGKIAEKQLSKSVEGQELLETLTANLDDEIANL